MQSGHRRALSSMMAFSVLNSSFGSPWMFQLRIFTGSPMKSAKLNFSLKGTSFSRFVSTHLFTVSLRYVALNAPRYAMDPAATSTSPVILGNCAPSSAAVALQRVFSPPRPSMSFSARSSLTVHSSTSASSFALLACFTLRSRSSASSLSTTSLSSACFLRSCVITFSSAISASASAAFLGATTLATRSYASMARTQQHSPKAAVEACLILAGSNSGFSTYGRILAMIAGGMLSLSYVLRLSRNPGSFSIFLELSQ
mmetsp:Transcript_27072/g.59096  ORF Transcript_27072/g.59096 Transcript_27072/m.59096 type:complete len:256 (-) Transcript_27072:1097-1864(-)